VLHLKWLNLKSTHIKKQEAILKDKEKIERETQVSILEEELRILRQKEVKITKNKKNSQKSRNNSTQESTSGLLRKKRVVLG